MLLALFQPLKFSDSFNQAIAVNVYAETICKSQAPLELASQNASKAAMEVFNRYRQRHIFPLEIWEPTEDLTEAELLRRWDEFSQKVCPERFE